MSKLYYNLLGCLKNEGCFVMDQEKERIFLELQKEIKAAIEAYERGEGIPLEEVIAKLNSKD